MAKLNTWPKPWRHGHSVRVAVSRSAPRLGTDGTAVLRLRIISIPALLLLVGLLAGCASQPANQPDASPTLTPRPATAEDITLAKEAVAGITSLKGYHISEEIKTNILLLEPGKTEGVSTIDADVESVERIQVKSVQDGRQVEAIRYDGLAYIKKDGAWVEMVESSSSDSAEIAQATRALKESQLWSETWPARSLDQCDQLIDTQVSESVGGTQARQFTCKSTQSNDLFGTTDNEVEFWVDPVARRINKVLMVASLRAKVEANLNSYLRGELTISRHNEAIKIENPRVLIPTATPRSVVRATVQVTAPASLCGTWEATEGPRMGNDGDFEDVTAISPSDVWAVGSKITGLEDGSRVSSEPLAAHWDGKAWSLVPVPEVRGDNESAYLKAVNALSSDMVWAVGYSVAASGETLPGRAIILRWDGSAWKSVPVPSPAPDPRYYALYDVSALSPQDVWAVGYYYREDAQDERPLAMHWNGTGWNVVPVADLHGSLAAVTAVSPSDVWAVGFVQDAALIVHYNGKEWARFPVEQADGIYGLSDVAAVSPSEVWAVGAIHRRSAGDNYLAMRWDGKSWTNVALPFPPRNGFLTGVAATSTGSLWIAGYGRASVSSELGDSLMLRWDGSKWLEVPNPQIQPDQWFEAVAAISDEEVWAVGGVSKDSAGYGYPEYGLYARFTAVQPCVQPSPTSAVSVAPTSPTPVIYSVPDAGRTGSSDEMGPGVMHGLAWKLTAEQLGITPNEHGSPERFASMVYADGTLYAVTNLECTRIPNYIYALDAATGQTRWKLKLESRFNFTTGPVVSNGVLYFGTEKYVVAIDSHTQREKWRFSPGEGSVTSDPVLSGNMAYITTGGYLYAVDRESGREKWRTESAGNYGYAPVVNSGLLFTMGYGDVMALDAVSGLEKWHGDLTGSVLERHAAAMGMVFVVFSVTEAAYSKLVALDLETGIERWAVMLPGTMYHSGPAVAKGVVYAGNGSKPGYLVAVDAATGKEKWRFNAESSYVGDPLVASGVLYFGSYEAYKDNGYMHAVDAATGIEMWRFEIDGPVKVMPAAGDGMLFFLSNKGTLYALR